MTDQPQYQAIKLPDKSTAIVEKSVQREDAFSKPGHMTRGPKSARTWKPAHGVRFRPTSEKAPGRRRKRARDERSVTFY